MPTIKELKEDLQFNTELIELLEVMKNTAVFQFRSLQSKKERFEKFFEAVKGFFRLMGDCRGECVLISPSSKKKAIIMVTSNEGFMGSLNSQVINIASLQDGFKDAELIIIGERGTRYLADMGRSFVPFNNALDSGDRYTLSAALGSYIIDGVKKGRFGKVVIFYPKPISFMIQRVEVAEILPLSVTNEPAFPQPLIIESPIGMIVDYLAEEMVRQKLIDVLEDSKLSEFAARAIHLESSSQELTEKKKKIKMQYFRAYHEMIDRSTRELFSAQNIIHKRDDKRSIEPMIS